jgi:SecD/SecF fusion protein
LLEVDVNDVRRQKLLALQDDVRRVLREARIGLTRAPVIRGNAVEVVIRESDLQQGVAKLRELSQPLGGFLGSTGARSIDVENVGGGVVRLSPTEPALIERVRQVVDQSVEIIGKRVNQLGLVEPSIQRQGNDRILVQVPGLGDPQQLLEILGKTAKLTFRLVDTSVPIEQALQGRPPPEAEIVYGSKAENRQPYLLEKRVIVSGEELTDAQPGFDQRTSEPIVTFKFNTSGARKFAQVTQENVGRPFAIVLDDEVISAPVIREPILGGSGQISGNFTVESANNLAILLRAGALPAKLTVIEQRVVGAGLGQDSIEKGKQASYFGGALVIIFMVVTYGLFGVFASIAVAINVGMIFGILSLLNATLTLPGIIGIVLTIGIAVDSNVLIYERIREEVRTGRTPITAIDAGFTRALATILDSNITTFIAAAVLFFFGSGPVRGFAVTLGIGIITTVFTAFMRFRRISFPISAVLSIIAILLYFFHGLNFGIDFVGGTLIEVQSKSGPADLAKMRAALSGLGLGEVQLQEFGGPTDVLIRVAQQPGGEQAQQAAINKVREALGSEVDYRRVEVVGPRVSSELLAMSTIGLGLAIFAILIYLWFRFEWQFSLGAMIANVHDLVLTIGYMSLTQIDFDLSSIAALLTILGYSLNDTVVIYDRIREMLRRYKRMSMPDLLNISVNSTLSRSIITHVTVTLALLALLLFGGHAIHSFVATMIFGVVLVGTYTSVFIAAPILIYLGVGTTRMETEDAAEKEKTSTARP